MSAYLMCVYLSEREDLSIIFKVCQVSLCVFNTGALTHVFLTLCISHLVQLLDEHMVEFTQYEQNLVPHGYQPPATSSTCYDHPSLTPTIDKIVELSTGAIRGSSFAPLPSAESVSMDTSDFECSLCTGLVYEPVTVTCGHSFCCSCLRRAFDHSHTCPVCRTVLHEVCVYPNKITCILGK